MITPAIRLRRLRFAAIGKYSNLAEALVTAANEGAVVLNPNFISHLNIPNVVMVPIADEEATWDVFVVWQRGKTSGPLHFLLDALQSTNADVKPTAAKIGVASKEPKGKQLET